MKNNNTASNATGAKKNPQQPSAVVAKEPTAKLPPVGARDKQPSQPGKTSPAPVAVKTLVASQPTTTSSSTPAAPTNSPSRSKKSPENEPIVKQAPHPPSAGTNPGSAAAGKHPPHTRGVKEPNATGTTTESQGVKQGTGVDSKTRAPTTTTTTTDLKAQPQDATAQTGTRLAAVEKPVPATKKTGDEPETAGKNTASREKTDVNATNETAGAKGNDDIISKRALPASASGSKATEQQESTGRVPKGKKEQSSDGIADSESVTSTKTQKANLSTGATEERSGNTTTKKEKQNVDEQPSKEEYHLPARNRGRENEKERREHDAAVWSAPPQEPEVVDEFDANGSDAEAVLNRLIYTEDGQSVMWGAASNGEFGQGLPLYMPCPRAGYSPYKIGSIACGNEHSAFLSYDGHVSCAGSGAYGQLGIGDPRVLTHYAKSNPIAAFMKEVPLPEETVQVSCGPTFTAALSIRGDVYMWGNNNNFQCTEVLSRYSTGEQGANETKVLNPHRVSIPNEQIVEVACGSGFVVARTLNHHVYTWGVDCCLGVGAFDELEVAAQTYNQRVVAVPNDRFATTGPVMVEALRGKLIKMVAAGPWHALAVSHNGDLYSWGLGKYGRLGSQCDDDQLTPQLVEAFQGEKVVFAACGSFHSVVLLQNGEVYAFGNNIAGQCGEATVVPVYTPVRLFIPSQVNSVFCGRLCTLVNAGRGDLYAFGSGVCTGLGFKYAPLRVYCRPAMSCFISFATAVGASHCLSRCIMRVMAISVIGDPHAGAAVKVTHVDLHDGLVSAALGYGFSIFVSRRGIVYSFGYNKYGQLGIGDKPPKGSESQKGSEPADKNPVADEPMRVELFSYARIAQVAAGRFHAGAVCESHHVFVWGSNQFCELGVGLDPAVTRHLMEPYEVPYLANKGIVSLAFGTGMSAALSANGYVYTWGSLANCGHGEDLDEETVPSRLIQTSCDDTGMYQPCLGQPVRIASIGGIMQIAAGAFHTLALAYTGVVFAWGAGQHGALGIGEDAQHAYEPVRVKFDPEVRIVHIGCGLHNSFAITDTADLYVWGSNAYDQCGVPGEPIIHTPRRVLSNVRSFSFSKCHGIGILYDGTIKFSGQVKMNNVVEVTASSFEENVVPELTKSSVGRGQVPCQTFSGDDHSIILLERFSPHPDVMKRCLDKLHRRPERKIVAANLKRANENRTES